MGAPTPICRDLTSTFKRYRSERRGNRIGRGIPTSDGARLLASDEEQLRGGAGQVGIEMSELPPQWIESADEAREDIKVIKQKMTQLSKMQTKRLLKVINDDAAPDKDVESVSAEITALIRRCESSIQQVKVRGGSGTQTDLEFRTNVTRNLATQLQTLSQSFRGSQKEYLGKIRQRQRGSLLDEPSPAGGAIDTGFSDTQMFELETMETSATQRSEEITQIASSINDLHTIFKELAVMVIDQGSILDRIDYNIEQVVHQSVEANKQLQKAEKSSKSNRATKCMLMLVLTNLILLIILILKSRH